MTTAQDQQSRAEFDLWYADHIGDENKPVREAAWETWQHLYEPALRALPEWVEPELHMARKPIGEVDGFTVWEYDECCDDDAIAFFTAAQVLAMGRVPPGWQTVPLAAAKPSGSRALLRPGIGS